MNSFNRRILVVDDSREIHDAFRQIFCVAEGRPNQEPAAGRTAPHGEAASGETTAAFELEFASQGQEAFELVRRSLENGRPYAMAFMDVRMPPGWDGIETTGRIRTLDPQLQVAICTGYCDDVAEGRGARLWDAEGFVILKKPFGIIEVRQLAKAFTEKWNRCQQDLERTRRLQDELGESRARLEYLLRSSPAIIYCVNASIPHDVTFVSDNISRILGYDARQFVGNSGLWKNHLHPDDAAESHHHRARLLEVGQHRIEYRLRHRDGTYRWIHDDAHVIRDPQGNPVEIVGYCTDITPLKHAEQERKLMEVQLRQAHKLEAIGQLAAGIAHEINTPTQYVGDNTRFLQDSFHNIHQVLKSHEELLRAARNRALTPELIARAEQTLAAGDLEYLYEQIPAAIKETLEGVERVSKIVRAMKDFSHPGSRERSAADLNQAIETTVTVARNEWKYVADLKLDLDPALPPVPCYVSEFNQAVLNLIVNAAHAIGDVVKATPGAKGVITVSTRRDGDSVEVRVGDTGTGIPAAIRPHIFEPFFTTKEVGKGTGQGLSIVYGSIVKRHGGSVRFDTEVGKGTTFILRLPIAPRTGEPELPSPEKSVTATPQPGRSGAPSSTDSP